MAACFQKDDFISKSKFVKLSSTIQALDMLITVYHFEFFTILSFQFLHESSFENLIDHFEICPSLRFWMLLNDLIEYLKQGEIVFSHKFTFGHMALHIFSFKLYSTLTHKVSYTGVLFAYLI